ncbi:MAG TPA: sulfurtransferase TusA family protein [Roseiarcus sp.]|jgi:tRNA 2-thiouridine synthesizing protein A
MVDVSLDVRGLNCPLPVFRARKAIRETPINGLLEVLATDPLAPLDFASFCETTGNELVESSASDGVFRFVIRRAA